MMVPASCFRLFSISRFRNLASNLPCFRLPSSVKLTLVSQPATQLQYFLFLAFLLLLGT